MSNLDDQPQAATLRVAAHAHALPAWHPRRLPVRIAATGALLLAASITLFTWIMVQNERNVGRLAAERQVHAIAHNLAAVSGTLLAEQGFAELDRMARRLLAFPSVERISVLDAERRVIVDLSRGDDGTSVQPADGRDLVPPSRTSLLRSSDRSLVLWMPVEEERLLGWLRVEQSLSTIHQMTQQIVRDSVILGIGAVGLAALLFILYVRRAMHGIEQATRFAAGLDQARGVQMPIPPGPAESQALGQALNQVSLRLAEHERALAASAHRLQTVLDSAVDGIFTADESGMIVDANPAAAQLFGYTQNNIRGRALRDLLPELALGDDADDDPPPRLADGSIVLKRDMPGRRSDGQTFPLRLGLSEIRIDDARLYIGIVRDFSDERRLEQMKDTFIAQMSHELRTPLTSLNAALALMSSDGPPGEARRLVEIAHNSSARLTRLVRDIVDYEQLAAGKLEFNIVATALAPIVDAAVADERVRAETLGVTIAYATPLPEARVLADPERLRQAIGKLLDNAVRMTARGDSVQVSVERRKNILQIGITDYGPGLPEDFRAQVFSRFSQVDLPDERYRSGAGLGLSLAKAIIGRLGGTIDYYSVPGVETKFFVEIAELYDEVDE